MSNLSQRQSRRIEDKAADGGSGPRIRQQDATHEALQHWFAVLKFKLLERNYDLCNIYNMDESGFGIGTSQTNRVMVNAICALIGNWFLGDKSGFQSLSAFLPTDKSPLVIFELQLLISCISPYTTLVNK